MKLFKVTMFNHLTEHTEESYIYSRNSKTAIDDLDCFRSNNFTPVESIAV